MFRAAVCLLALWASSASAGTDELRELIQNKIMINAQTANFFQAAAGIDTSATSIDCSAGQNLYCPLSKIPNITFSSEAGSFSTDAAPCCPKKYLQCQVQQNTQYCRILGYYNIPSSTANSGEKCPATTANCTCQQSLSASPSLRINLCPNTTPCCPKCECYGDPHCHSFTDKVQIWALCDSRDATCVHKEQTCSTQTYGGQTCKWVPGKNGLTGYCTRADNVAAPTMLMYKKTYKQYFVPSDNTVYTFTLTLTLGTYGAISSISLLDTGVSNQPYTWLVDAGGNCQANSAFPFIKGTAKVKNLPSMVSLQIICVVGNGRSPTSGRLDILDLEDPWYTSGDSTMSGFCATGVIAEAPLQSTGSLCSIADRQITMFLGCPVKTPLNSCKSQWCSENYYKLDYSNIAKGATTSTIAQKRKACGQYVNNAESSASKNFLATVCATSPKVANGVLPQDPSLCETNDDCKACMDNILDYPDEIAIILGGSSASIPPTKVCPNLLTIGLARKQLGVSQSGVEIDFRNPTTNTWEPIFALFNEEIDQCDCESIFVNGTQLANRVLFNPGNYRIRQCNGLDTDPSQDMCTSSPGYNASVVYLNPASGAAFSEPLGVLFTEDRIVCNPKKYPSCPPNYRCCQWTSSKYAWEDCMLGLHKADWRKGYPNCEYPGK